MGKLALTRIDARLIHGQIASKWSKVLNISKIVSGVNVYFQSLPEPEDKPHELDMVLNKLKL